MKMTDRIAARREFVAALVPSFIWKNRRPSRATLLVGLIVIALAAWYLAPPIGFSFFALVPLAFTPIGPTGPAGGPAGGFGGGAPPYTQQMAAPSGAFTGATGAGAGGPQSVVSGPGLVSNSTLHPNPRVSGIPISPPFGIVLHTQRFTSATALAPPVSNMSWIDCAVEGGATAGGLAFTGLPPSVSIFAAPASGTDATGAIGAERCIHYPLNYIMGGTNFASSLMVFKGGLGAVTVTYSNVPVTGNPDISAYRAVFVTGAESGTGGTSRTATFDAAPSLIRAVIVMINVASGTATGIPAGNVQYPADGGFQQQVPAQGPTSDLQAVGVQPFPAANSVVTTHTATTLGGATTVTLAALHLY